MIKKKAVNKEATTKPVTTTSKEMAAFALRPAVNAGAVIKCFEAPYGELDHGEVMRQAHEQIKAIQEGDLSNVEAMLFGQALALQSIFVAQARRAKVQEHLPAFQVHFNLALKAQAQCRATLEALAEVKNPKATTFVRQQNNAHQQQVNNVCDQKPSASRTEKNINPSNKLLEANHGERLDTRKTCEAGGSNPHMETVGAIHRSSE